MKVEFTMDIAPLPSTQAMWERAQALYQPSSHALYISTLELASSLRQQDSSVNIFYRQLTDVWRQLDSLAPAYCRRVTVVLFAGSMTVFFACTSFSVVCAPSLSSFWLARLCHLWWRRSSWLALRRHVFVACFHRPQWFWLLPLLRLLQH